MLIVGLTGGFAFVNNYKLLLEDKSTNPDEKEITIGLCKNLYKFNFRLHCNKCWHIFCLYSRYFFSKYHNEIGIMILIRDVNIWLK